MKTNHKKRIIISVTNDLSTDQRIDKVAKSLLKIGYSPVLVGFIKSKSLELSERAYETKRFRVWFTSGILFYAEYNLRLFLYLLFSDANLFLSNDLDTLFANYLASFIRKKTLIYDSHELFTEQPELENRLKVKKIWLKIEQFILPKISNSYTVSASIARYYRQKYGLRMEVIRNFPTKRKKPLFSDKNKEKQIIYQGMLNKARGLEQLIVAMKHIENTTLHIFGTGEIEEKLHQLIEEKQLSDKICFHGRIHFEKLHEYTQKMDLGVSLEQDIGLSYRYALPNKLFDYIQAEIPVLVSPLPEMRAIVEEYDVGAIVDSFEEKKLAAQIIQILSDEKMNEKWQKNLKKAANQLVWEQEETKLIAVFRSLS